MEASVLDPKKTPNVAQIIQERFIAVELYTDLPHKIPEEQKNLDLLLRLNGGVPSAIPVYAIVQPDGETLLARRDGRQSTEEFLRFLNLEPAD